MKTLNFSVAEHFPDADAFFKNLSKTCENKSLGISTQTVPWQIMWSYLQRTLISTEPFDVSEVGSTWVASFADIDALCEFDNIDLLEIDAPNRFVDSAWQSTSLIKDSRILSIPWMVDTRVIFYWKDILKSANIDEEDAFTTPARMNETLAKLKSASKPTLAIPTFAVTNTVHQIASWLRSTGADFLNENATATAFCNEDAVEGIISYFELVKYLTRKYDSFDIVLESFQTKKAAVMISGPWFIRYLKLHGATEKYLANLGIALPPGPPFVGGSNLVIWKREDAKRSNDAVEWVRHLTSTESQKKVCEITGLLPAVKGLLSPENGNGNQFQEIFAKALKNGRPLPQVAFWGAIEAELVRVFGNIWSDLKEDPRYTVRSVVLSHLEPMAQIFDDKLYRHSIAPKAPA